MSIEYPKIHSIYKRDDKGKFLFGEYSKPEFEYLRHNQWDFTEKVDGTNIRLAWHPVSGLVTIKGKSDKAEIPRFLYEKLEHIVSLLDFGSAFGDEFDVGDSVTLYGEGYGAKIQKGGGNYIPDGVDFILFDVKVNKWWLSRANVVDVARKLGLDFVPYVGSYTLSAMESIIKNNFYTSFWPFVKPEGVVGRPVVPLFDNKGNRITVKIKGVDYED